MRRREFVTLLGGAVAAWPLTSRAQQAQPMRRIGMLIGFAEVDVEAQARISALRQGLQELGWSEGRNIRTDYRFCTSFDPAGVRTLAAQLVDQTPDLVVAITGNSVRALLETSRTIPIVFIQIPDPVPQGFVASLAHPGGNVTGLPVSNTEPEASGLRCSRKSRRASIM
jgi:putative tryptophan/tyrosine transport system substrate-binding protein